MALLARGAVRCARLALLAALPQTSGVVSPQQQQQQQQCQHQDRQQRQHLDAQQLLVAAVPRTGGAASSGGPLGPRRQALPGQLEGPRPRPLQRPP